MFGRIFRRRYVLAAALWAAGLSPGTASATSVLLIGDSIFSGVGAGGGSRGVWFQLQGELRNVFVYNYSAPGTTMAGLYAPIPHYAAYIGGVRKSIRLAVIGLGVNDWRTNVPVDYFASKYAEFVHDLQEKIPEVACVAPLWSTREGRTNRAGKTIQDYRTAIRDVCDRPELKRFYWNGLSAIPPDPRFFVDGLHPSRRGHRRYAKWLRDRLREAIGASAAEPGATPAAAANGR